MKTNRLPKWKVVLAALLFSSALILTQTRTAHAYCIDAYSCGAIVGLFATYVTVLTAVCTPVAAIKSWNNSASFGGAFKDCWYWHRPSEQPASKEADESEAVVAQEEAENSISEE